MTEEFKDVTAEELIQALMDCVNAREQFRMSLITDLVTVGQALMELRRSIKEDDLEMLIETHHEQTQFLKAMAEACVGIVRSMKLLEYRPLRNEVNK